MPERVQLYGRPPMPERVQLSRRKGWRMPGNTVYVGRPSLWGNPWSIKDATEVRNIPTEQARAWCVVQYQQELTHWGLLSDYGLHASDGRFDALTAAIDMLHLRNMGEVAAKMLRGKNLACWCPLDQPCHADVLLRIANEDTTDA